MSLSSGLAYSPQDNFVQQNMYELTGAYLGETVDELHEQNLLTADSIGRNVILLETVDINGVILKKGAIANIANNQLCSLIIEFDNKDIEKTKKVQAYFVNKLGQPTLITQPTEDMKRINMILASYSWENQTYYITVGQGRISFSEKNLSREVSKKVGKIQFPNHKSVI